MAEDPEDLGTAERWNEDGVFVLDYGLTWDDLPSHAEHLNCDGEYHVDGEYKHCYPLHEGSSYSLYVKVMWSRYWHTERDWEGEECLGWFEFGVNYVDKNGKKIGQQKIRYDQPSEAQLAPDVQAVYFRLNVPDGTAKLKFGDPNVYNSYHKSECGFAALGVPSQGYLEESGQGLGLLVGLYENEELDWEIEPWRPRR